MYSFEDSNVNLYDLLKSVMPHIQLSFKNADRTQSTKQEQLISMFALGNVSSLMETISDKYFYNTHFQDLNLFFAFLIILYTSLTRQ